MSVYSTLAGFWVWFLLLLLASVAVQVLLAFSVYYDARARGNSEPLMWALLVGFLGWIPGIIYLCIRNSAKDRMILCPNCGAMHPISLSNCPQCGIYNQYCYPFYNPETPVLAAKAKKLFIAAMIVLGACVLLGILFFTWMIVGVSGQIINYGY